MTDEPVSARILIAEDETSIAADLESRLIDLGYNVLGNVATGESVLKFLDHHRPDLVVIDIALNGEPDGVEIAGVIRDRWNIPVVFLIGHADTVLLERARSTSPFGYLVKPLRDTDVKITMETALYAARVDRERRLADKALREREKSLGRALRMAKVGSWRYDPVTGKSIWSEEMFRIFGLEPRRKAPHYEEQRKIIHPDDRELLENLMNKAVQGGQGYNIELRVIRPDGEFGDVEIGCEATVDEDGVVTELVGMVRDITSRKRFEDELRLTRFSLDQASPAIYWTDAVGSIEYVNHKACENLGYSKAELSNMTMRDVDPEYSPGLCEQYRDRTRGNGPIVFESTHRRKDGSIFPVEISVSQGEFEGRKLNFSSVHDLTRRKQAERNLTIMMEMLDAAPSSITIHDYQGNFLYANPKTFEILGYGEDELMALNISDIDVPEIVTYIEDRIRLMIDKGEISFRVSHNRKDGTTIPLEVYARKVEWTGGPAILSIATDITSRKIAEEAIRESSQRYRELFQTIKDIIYTQDLDGRFTSVNPALCQAFGYEKNEMIGRRASEFMKPELAPAFASEYLGKLKKFGYHEGITSYFTKKGKKVYLEYKSSLVKPDDKEAYISGIGRDVTEKILSERKLKEIQTQLQQAQKMEAIGTLAGGVAHDFNNLLQIINGYAQILLARESKDDPDYPKLKAIQNAGARAAELVSQLLLFSRKAETEMKPVHLNRDVEQVRSLLERTIPKMIDIEVHYGRRLWTINADPVQMEQILLNLGKNAADAMPDGGKLTIETKNVILDEEYAQSHLGATPGSYVLLSVSDTGHGMDKETVERIFEPFFTTKEIGKGTGLGLASVYGIVKSHGGYIMCYSEVDQGTIFRIYLPALEKYETEEPEVVVSKPPTGGTETLLLVDDESSIREFASQVLGEFGYTILTASSGEEALEIYSAKSHEIDLVILDIGMPGMGGFKCLCEIIQLVPSAKVIVATGYSINGHVKKTLEAGAAGYVGKPYKLNNLLEKVRAVLDEKPEL